MSTKQTSAFRPQLEALEDRFLPATIHPAVVTPPPKNPLPAYIFNPMSHSTQGFTPLPAPSTSHPAPGHNPLPPVIFNPEVGNPTGFNAGVALPFSPINTSTPDNASSFFPTGISGNNFFPTGISGNNFFPAGIFG